MSRQKNEYITNEHLAQWAEELAGEVRECGKVKSRRIAEEILNSLHDIKKVHRKITGYAAESKKIPQEMEWLLDNWYMAEREGRESAKALFHGGKVRQCGDKALVLWMAEKLVMSGRNVVTAERIESFLMGFQQKVVLSEREISILIPVIKGELVKNLRDICVNELDGHSDEETNDCIGNVFTSLRLMTNIDMSEVLESISFTENIMATDPAGIYADMEEKTRQNYRREIARLAKKTGMQDYEVAMRLVELASNSEGKKRHVGYYIYEKPLGQDKKRSNGTGYIGLIIGASILLSLISAMALGHLVLSLLLLFPISEIVKNVVDYFSMKIFRPVHVHRMKLHDGVPVEGRTLCVISALLSDEKSGSVLAGKIEEYSLANRDSGKNLIFGILADFPESTEKDIPEADIWLDKARAEIEGLNKKYDGEFLLLCRDRRYNERDDRYMGWERKRGAILELTRLLKGKSSSVRCEAGNLLKLEGVKYVITLDSDTRLNVGAAKELIGAMLHPLNTPEISDGKVIEGAGLIQPRVSVDLDSANKTDFTRIFAGQGGIDPYASACSDVYQDLFEEGSFTGKGIFSVDAYDRCLNQAFPENTILSHDLLEGAYLKGKFMGDVELSDGYPKNPMSYYKRMHRWTRGDWQSAPWIFPVVRNANGDKVRNPISKISKWKIFDNLRRSLVPICTVLAILLGMLVGGMGLIWVAVIAVLSPISSLLINSAELVFRRNHGTKARYHSTIISGFVGGFMETMCLLILLPYHAYICLSGAVTALYRMFISKKNMLSWVAAADTEKQTKNTAGEYIIQMLPAVIVGLLVIFFSRFPAAIAVGVVWALSPLYAFSLSLNQKGQREVSEDDELYLKRSAADIWRYFEELLTPEDHFLPPDNWQEQPAAGIAHRTSPTNIGLALLSSLAAIDLNLTPRHRAMGYIENILATIERMEKWNGHLYNWYDTKSLRPLTPAYVSAVDSGNFLGCLIVLREALYEHAENGLAARTDALIKPMDFSVLFDDKRNLFYIGWDMSTDAPTEGWYDLMASEARQTSYIAIAKGDVPAKHWRRLGRSLVSQDNYSGMASWTGTMFEYMMPNLIMPCYKNSLIYESLKFCVYVQKKHSKPWGISESGFYAFDPDLNYSYKAHGVQRLAFKRGLDRELVISPYSTFLALQVDCKNSVKNLREIEKLGGTGKYGFYEALDYTPTRQTGDEFQIVKTYLAHHLGMSLVSICNTLTEGIMQKRFLRDRSMAAYSELLQEKVPVGQIVLNQPPREVPDKPARISGAGWSREFEGIDVLDPACTVLSNGGYSVMLTESGISRSMASGGIMLTRFEPRQSGESMGMSFYLKMNDGDILSLQSAPEYSGNSSYSCEFTGNEARLFSEKGNIESMISISVPSEDLGEVRRVTIKNTGQTSAVCELVCYFEPVLERPADYFAHPAFSKLGLETSYKEDAIVIKRRSNGEKPERYMAFCASKNMEYDTSREYTIGREGIKGGILKPAGGNLGTVIDPCVMVKVPISLLPNQCQQVTFALATGEKEKDALLSVKRVMATAAPMGISFTDDAAHKLGMRSSDIDFAMDMITDITFTSFHRLGAGEAVKKAMSGQSSLWPFGISGDLPIIAVDTLDEDTVKIAERCIKSKMFLHRCGIHFDLVLIVRDGGDYRQPVRTEINDIISEMGAESFVGSRAGIHLVDGNLDIMPIMAAARRVYPKDLSTKRDIRLPEIPKRPNKGNACRAFINGYDKNNSYVFSGTNSMPPNAWCHMLSNGTFGYLATDSGTGHMWHLNARENKITPWKNDALITEGPEQLTLLRDGERISLFASMDGYHTKVSYGFGYAMWEKKIGETQVSVTAFVPPDINARVFIVQGEFEPNDEIAYFAQLVMCGDEINSSYIITDYSDGIISAENVGNTEFKGDKFSLAASEEERLFTCDRREYLMGHIQGSIGAGLDPCFYASYPAGRGLVIVTGCEKPEELKKLTSYKIALDSLENTKAYWNDITGTVEITTPNENMNKFLNGWAVYQTLVCRIMGRSSIYQSGGAYGFRDQLQDSSALIAIKPEVAKRQIIMAAEHQYEEGDVQHWWHPAGESSEPDKGVRTKCSDDLLWLPYLLCEYVEVTGDTSILDMEAGYITSEVLGKDENERYEMPKRSNQRDSIYMHAVRAVDMVLRRSCGSHGLLLVGTGDWNDGMNLVGVGGKGESVWLTWFLCHVLERFAHICDKKNDPNRSHIYTQQAKNYANNANKAWDGQWFLRGYYDSGDTLGSSKDSECKIDSIAQSFSTLTSLSDENKSLTALTSAVNMLHDKDNKVVKLFDPAFEKGDKNPGYIRGYAPGLRENGGQYTHGAIWLAMGCLNRGMTQEGFKILSDLLPKNHDEEIYRVEPYVIAADVYSNPQHTGRGGWSWYTGAAGWYYRVATENLLGLKVRDGKLTINPNLPKQWHGFSVKWKHGDGEYKIEVTNGQETQIYVDGEKWDGKPIALSTVISSKA